MTVPAAPAGPAPPALYWARVMHARTRPVRHRFVYDLFTMVFDIDALDALDRRLHLFARNRFNALSFHDRDHGPRDGSALRPWLERMTTAGGAEFGGGPVRLLCFPRVFGYVFNPISVYFCHRPDGTLATIVYQVHNTFGGQHVYVARVGDGLAPDQPLRHAADKVFYVSPFIGMQARYAFRLRPPGEHVSLAIHETTPEGHLLTATLTGTRAGLSDGLIARALLRFPFMTLRVIAGIHWQALKLWWKGARYHPDAPAPPAPVTRASADGGAR